MFPNRDMARSRAKNNSTAYQKVRQLFDRGGYNGFILDAFDISTLNQVSTGTTPVTAVTQPIGWFGDKHLGMQLGPELVTNGDFSAGATGWSDVGTSIPSTVVNGRILVTGDANTDRATQTIPVTAGKTYKLSGYQEDGTSTSSEIRFYGIPGYVSLAASTAGTDGDYTFYSVIPSGVTSIEIWLRVDIGSGSFDNISVKLLDGNHALQATGPARPSWQVDANGYHYAQFLGTDDSLSCATGGGGSTGFLFCAALKPTGGAGTHRMILDNRGANVGYIAHISDTNVARFVAGNGTAWTTIDSVEAMVAGVTKMVTFYDDGSTMNVQVNQGAVNSIARPVVQAGPVNFSLFKNNAAASEFLIADFYRAVYIKNWAGTAAQLAAIQSYVKAGAGL